MLAIAFWLAIVTFFIPKKYKQICGYVSMGISTIVLLLALFMASHGDRFLIGFGIANRKHVFDGILNFCNFFYKFNPLSKYWYLIRKFIKIDVFEFWYFLTFVLFGIYLSIAYAATKVSIIKYKSDKEFEEGDNSETTSDIVSTAADGRLLRVVEVNAGLCTGTLRGAAIEAKINKMAAEGWKFEQFESIIGRCCLIFARYKAVICFSKEK